METVNLKSAVTFRVQIQDRTTAFETKTFRGERGGRGTIPEPKEHVPFTVHEINLPDSSLGWFPMKPPARIEVLWSNVLSVQHDPQEDNNAV